LGIGDWGLGIEDWAELVFVRKKIYIKENQKRALAFPPFYAA